MFTDFLKSFVRRLSNLRELILDTWHVNVSLRALSALPESVPWLQRLTVHPGTRGEPRHQLMEGLPGQPPLQVGDVLSALPALTHCAMQSWRCDDGDLAKLSALSRLVALQLEFKGALGSAGAGALACMPGLRSLHLSGVERVLVHHGALAPLTALQTLTLSRSDVPDEDLGCLSALSALTELSLAGCRRVEGFGLVSLFDLPSLAVVTLPTTDNANWPVLARLPHLTRLCPVDMHMISGGTDRMPGVVALDAGAWRGGAACPLAAPAHAACRLPRCPLHRCPRLHRDPLAPAAVCTGEARFSSHRWPH